MTNLEIVIKLKFVRDAFKPLAEVFDPESPNYKECSVAFSKLNGVISSLEKTEIEVN